ncbi:hypothetical protein CJ030_MR7G011819 [Morella rubra]|uniref:Uncharacterized protein n=1 Tax=Morella rubra TaxID=262757 RepID=A0A6A1V507_9ROSI|nr:hypothetical protein CJ030_MR7G011813 [Morella rubra]KAB1206326.1 hypothetical protein CJ030_MR7G011819 [Morella rubra]
MCTDFLGYDLLKTVYYVTHWAQVICLVQIACAKHAVAKNAQHQSKRYKQPSPTHISKKCAGPSTEPVSMRTMSQAAQAAQLSARFKRGKEKETTPPPPTPVEYDIPKFLNSEAEELYKTKFGKKDLIIEREVFHKNLSEICI